MHEAARPWSGEGRGASPQLRQRERVNAAPRGRHALLGGAPQKRDDGQALRRRVHQGAPPAAPPKNLCAALRVGTASPIARLSWRNNGPGASDSARPSDEHPSPGLTAAALGRADAARTARLRHQCHRRTARRLSRVRHPSAAAASLPRAGSAGGACEHAVCPARCARRRTSAGGRLLRLESPFSVCPLSVILLLLAGLLPHAGDTNRTVRLVSPPSHASATRTRWTRTRCRSRTWTAAWSRARR